MSEHVKPEQSLALMALAANDPERLQAERHASMCHQCRATLDEGQAMLGLVDAFGSIAETSLVDAVLKARVRQVVLKPVVKPTTSWAKWSLALGMLVSLVLAWFDAEPGVIAVSQGMHCMLFENMIAVAPFALAAWLGTRGVIRLEPLNLAAVSMAGALAGQVALLSRCPSHTTSHLFVFHVLGVALAATLGLAATAGLVRLRSVR